MWRGKIDPGLSTLPTHDRVKPSEFQRKAFLLLLFFGFYVNAEHYGYESGFLCLKTSGRAEKFAGNPTRSEACNQSNEIQTTEWISTVFSHRHCLLLRCSFFLCRSTVKVLVLTVRTVRYRAKADTPFSAIISCSIDQYPGCLNF